jgi:hypothetical protein
MCSHSDYVWFAHNAGYDWRYVLDYLRSTPYKIQFSLRSDNSIFAIRVEFAPEKFLLMRDSYAIWPHTLRQLADAFCPELPKGDIDFGTCTFDPRQRAHVEYAKRDSEILVRGLRRFNEVILQRYDVNLAGTLASTALRAWERMLPEKVKEVDWLTGETSWRRLGYFNPAPHEDFIRSAYFGGLVFLTSERQHEGQIHTYDRNSSYPAAMREGVPYGSVFTTRYVRRDRPGIYDVTIGAPDNLRVPIIPIRVHRGRDRAVLWPRGIFRTTVTSQELDFATRHGYRVYEVHEGRFWDGIIFPFNDFVDRAEEIRASFKGRTEEIVAKLIQNALYGKTVARRERRSLIHHTDVESVHGYFPWDEQGEYLVKTEYVDDMMCLPQWGVWITANARLAMLRMVYDVIGVENVLYGDTDSITCYGSMPTGKAYGAWKLEKTWAKFRPIAPKVYAGQLIDGTWTGAAKGIPSKQSKEELFRRLYEEGQVSVGITSLPSLMVTMKNPDARIKSITRKSTDIENSRNWQREENGAVLPRYARTR